MRNQLPASPEQFDDRAFINGLPYSVGHYNINVGTSGMVQELVPITAGYLLLELQETAELSPLGCFAFNMNVPNFERSQSFSELVITAIELIGMRLSKQNVQPNDDRYIEQIVAETAGTIVDVFKAMYVQRYPALEQFLTDEEYNAVNPMLAFASDLDAEMNAFKASNQRQQSGGFNRGGNNFGGRGQQPQQQQRSNMGGGGFSMRGRGSQEPRPARVEATSVFGGKPVERTEGRPAFGAGVNNTNFGNTKSKISDTMVSGRFGGQKPRAADSLMEMANRNRTQQNQQVEDTHVHKVALDRATPRVTVKEEPQFIDLVPITKDNKRTFTLDKPYAVLYNPTKEVPFYAKTQKGDLIEAILSKQEVVEMQLEYFEHELNSTFRAAVKRDMAERGDATKIIPLISSVAEPLKFADTKAIIADKRLVPENKDIKAFALPVIIENSFVAAGWQDAIGQAETKLVQNDLDAKSFVECTYLESQAYAFTVEQWESFELLGETVDPITLAKSLYDIKDSSNERWWYDLNARLTAIVNNIFATTIPLGWEIKSFVDDVEEIAPALVKKEMVNLISVFDRHVMQEIGELFANATITNEKGEPVILADVAKDTLVTFSHRVKNSISRIPVHSGDLNIQLASGADKAGMVSDARFPVLHKSLASIYLRNENVANRFILLADGTLLKVYRSPMNKDVYLLGKA